MSLDVTHLTLHETAASLGLRSKPEPDYEGEEQAYREYLADPAPHPVDYPVSPDPACPECGGGLAWNTEVSGRFPEGTGYDVLVCEECETEAERNWVGF